MYERKLDSRHGDGVVKRLSVDLKAMYPKMGMSVSNLWAMKKFYVQFHLSDSKLRRSVGVLPWRHINQLMTKLKDDDDAIQYYAQKTIEKGWNCDLMVNAIKMGMHTQFPEINTTNNFALTLSETQATYANEVFRDSYCMGFLGVTEPILGKMNVYLSLLDRLEKGKDENPSIGIILCAEKDNAKVELALDGFTKPIGVADYKLIIPQKELKQLISEEIKSFNREYHTSLPTIL